jgi:hypothetical protein
VSFTGDVDFETVEVINYDGTDGYTGDAFSLGGFGFDVAGDGSDIDMSFDLQSTDGDGDIATGTLDVTVTPDDGNITGTIDSEVIVGGAGNDILTGLAGNDIFYFGADDDGTLATPAADTITDFNALGESDSIDLADLLVGEESNPLTDYLSVAEDGTDLVISVTPDGAGTDMTQTITLQDTSLADLGATLGDTQINIINDLITNGHINVDS